jgi:4a-hydroxytetrahydrobiopterin dehydratase
VASRCRPCHDRDVVDTHRLSDVEAEQALAGLAGWRREGATITATYAMESFPLGIELVRRAANSAEAANHHPDIDVRYRHVTFRLTTHDAGGLTPRDVHLARRIQGHATALGWVVP